MSNALLEPQDEQASAHDLWSVAQGEKNGRPLVIRFRTARPQDAEPAAFPFLLSATWTFPPNEHGLPAGDEMERMDKFEDALDAALEASQTAHLMVVLTGDGERDWLWYATGEEQAMQQVNQALRGHPRYPVEFSVQKDRAWRAYAQFENSNSSSASGGGTLLQRLFAAAAQVFCR